MMDSLETTDTLKEVPDLNKVPGFSERFRQLMSLCSPKGVTLTERATLHGVVFNTMKNWAYRDTPPRTFPALISVVTAELEEGGLLVESDPKAVALWLIGGDAARNPFVKDGACKPAFSPAVAVAIIPRLVDAGKEVGVDYFAMSEDQQKQILEQAIEVFYASGLTASSSKNEIERNVRFTSIVPGLLSLASLDVKLGV